MTDIVSIINNSCPPDAHDLSTAEGRKAWDDSLRAELKKIECQHLRSHASELIKEWRYEVIYGVTPRELMSLENDRFTELSRRVEAIEALLRRQGAAV